MVTRCGFFVEDGELYRKDVYIDWELGFDKAAKHEYIKRIQFALGPELSPCVDVTTASPVWEARGLSPHFLKAGDLSIEDAWAQLKVNNIKATRIPGAFDFLYLNALSPEQLKYVMKQKCFIDVFHNPERAFNTQAKSLAVYQLLVGQDAVEILKNLSAFSEWYMSYCMDIN